MARMKRKEPHNLLQWTNAKLGFGIAKHFMIPYNEKIWNCSLTDISLDLIYDIFE